MFHQSLVTLFKGYIYYKVDLYILGLLITSHVYLFLYQLFTVVCFKQEVFNAICLLNNQILIKENMLKRLTGKNVIIKL